MFFAGGEDEKVAREHVGECRPWPQEFREKKALFGLAAAAIVSPITDNNDIVKIGHISRAVFASSDMVTATGKSKERNRGRVCFPPASLQLCLILALSSH